MYVRIEPSGCCERKGLVQIRLSMYLEPDDYGYEKHHVQIPDFNSAKYDGEIKNCIPADGEHFSKWAENLPKVWQNNPFHNHFIYVEPDITLGEIEAMAEAFLHEAGFKWGNDQECDLKNPHFKFPENVSPDKKDKCSKRAKEFTGDTIYIKVGK